MKKAKKNIKLKFSEGEFLRYLQFTSNRIEYMVLNAKFSIVQGLGANFLPINYRLRRFLMKDFQIGFKLYIQIDNFLARVFPKFCAFYFLILQK